VRVFDANWMQIEEYLTRDDRIVLPTGSTEQHGYLSLGTDAILAERVAVEAAVNGHGGTRRSPGFLREWACQPRPQRVRVLFHSWYNAPQTVAAADRFDRDQMHGGWVENFAWTRLPGVELPAKRAPVVSRELIGLLDAAEVRAAAPDGMMGGAYARPDGDMRAVWDAGVAEVRELIETGWAA